MTDSKILSSISSENGQKQVLESEKLNLEVKNIIRELKRGYLSIRNVPEEFALDINIVRTERNLGLRKSNHRGFDVIEQEFFVEEDWIYKTSSNENISKQYKMTFKSFKEYYEFLDGDIYENACYYQYNFDDKISKMFKLDINKLREKKCFINETIDEYSDILTQSEIDSYRDCEKLTKRFCKRWIEKFNMCNTYEEFKKVCNNYERSKKNIYISFFFFQYAFYDRQDKKRLSVIMEYLSNDYWASDSIAQELCLIYNPSDVIEKYNFSQGASATNAKRKKKVKEFVDDLEYGDIKKEVRGYFDKLTHYYCEETKVCRYIKDRGIKVFQAFETFDEFIRYRNGDLRNCDLSDAIELDVDFSQYLIDNTTKLPIRKNANLDYKVKKTYDNKKFFVEQFWYNQNDQIVKKYLHTFEYFFDFVAFLKGDLSEANLIFCTGMKNLSDIKDINLQNAKLTSNLCELFHVAYKKYNYNKNLISEFSLIEKNEKDTTLILQALREKNEYNKDSDRISYISDLHLMHRIKNAGCKSKEDVIYVMQNIINNIVDESGLLTLIGGDISSEFSIFELFVKMLRKSTNKNERTENNKYIFILGNHELWNFPEMSIEQIVQKYRNLLENYGMYLLHNELLYEEYYKIGIISYNELMQLDTSSILEKVRTSRWLILGGLGFSGYNKEFNANNGIYRNVVDRNVEIQESKRFEKLYNKLLNLLSKKNTIIFTHTPKKDWCIDESYHENFVYINGHTHRNIFFDDGIKRLYADNQIGYKNENSHLKSFLIDRSYDYFIDYKDGIYEITGLDYMDFIRGKNLPMSFNRNINILYMLKKNGYYCFINKTKQGSLSILNGGCLKKLDKKDILYYYNNMDAMVSLIENPLDKYTIYQENIANEIKKIGGSGKIHGCIIDIDFFNHIYVNPMDMTITGYYANDMIDKIVYPDVPELLKQECPALYSKYLNLIESEKQNLLIAKQITNEIKPLPETYLKTDIYEISREIRKMQKLNCNILTTWYDGILDKNILPYKK